MASSDLMSVKDRGRRLAMNFIAARAEDCVC